jgi:Domain of unknown function (DUF4351)
MFDAITSGTLRDRIISTLIVRKVCRRQSAFNILNIYIAKPIIVYKNAHPTGLKPETLWFRLLGKKKVQSNAIAEVAALPPAHPCRQDALSCLGNLRVILEAREIKKPEDEELIMQLSPLYLEKIQAAELAGEQRGEVNGKTQGRVEEARSLIIRLLTRKLGNVSPPLLIKIEALSLERVESLGEDLLDFTSIANLEQWLT